MIYRFSAFTLDPGRLELTADGEPVAVQPQVFALLVFLIENRDRVVTKDEIIEAVWEGRIVSDGTLNTRINAARRALGDSGDTQAVIKTFPRRGFRFVAELAEDEGAPAQRPAQAKSNDRPSIAVLPFANISGDPDQEYFSDGITEDIITDLAKTPGLMVIARNSAFAFKGMGVDLGEIRRVLGVSHVLEGSVRKAGDQIRINAQLIDAATGGHVWAERYDGRLEGIFALQDEITAKIVAAMQINLAPVSAGGSRRRSTTSVEAYEYYLQARAGFFLFTPETNAATINLFQRAIDIDPDFASAWAGLVFPYQSGWSFIWPGYDDGIHKAREVAERAVALDPSSSFTKWRLGWALIFLRQHDDAVACFDRALEIEPNNAEAYSYFAEVLNFAGDPGRAVEMSKTAIGYDPVVPPNCAFHLGHSYFLLARLEEAVAQIQRSIDLAPSFPVSRMIMAAALTELQRDDEAGEHIATLRRQHPQHSLSTVNQRYPYRDEAARARVLDGLRSAGLPEV